MKILKFINFPVFSRPNNTRSQQEKRLSNTAQPQNKIKSNLIKIRNYFNEFCDNTSIHGLKFLVERRRCVIERLWWLVVLGMCLYICGNLILRILKQWEENPVFISFSTNALRIWEIPFPAVTICPGPTIKQSEYNLTGYLEKFEADNLTENELKNLMDLCIFCILSVQKFKNVPHSDHQAAFENIIKPSLALEDMRVDINSSFMYDDPTRDSSISTIFTRSGVCFSFNMLDKSELFNNITYVPEKFFHNRNISNWSADHNYIKTNDETYPIRMTRSTNRLSLYFSYLRAGLDPSCFGDFNSFLVILHHPAEVPTVHENILFIDSGMKYTVQLDVEATITSSNIKHYSGSRRGCYFSKERHLKFYKTYTEHNCRVECMRNYTLEKCGCVRLYMPHEESTEICGPSKLRCSYHAENEIIESFLEMDIPDYSIGVEVTKVCDCLPSCTSIKYQLEVQKKENLSILQNSSMSVELSFKKHKFVTLERNEVFSSVELWSNIGGLFGLFTGFSVISLAEIVYFCFLRWLCNVWNIIKKQKVMLSMS